MKNLFTFAIVAGLVVAAGWLAYFGPYYKDFYTMEEVVQTVALNWGAYTRTRAEGELENQLRRREIDYITPEHCRLQEQAGEKVVTCAWQVDVYPPLVGGRRLEFEVEGRVDSTGNLVKN